MKTEKNKTPTLRFPEFTSGWKVKSLKDVSSKISDGIHSTPNYDVNGMYFFVNGNNLNKGKITFNEKTKKVSEVEYIKHKKELSNRSILMSINGTIGCLAMFNNEKIILGKSACYINLDKTVEKLFIYNLLQHSIIRRYFTSELTGSTIKNLSLKAIKNCKLSLPSLPEQEKIASFLTSIDKKTELLTKKVDLLKKYKKGLIKKIFSKEIRFRNDTGEDFENWKEKKLGDILNYEQPTKYLVSNTEYKAEYETPVLTAGKTFILGYTNEYNGIFKSKLPVIIFDDFTTASKLVNFPFKVKSSAMKILQSREGINLKFVFEAIQNIDYVVGGHKRHWISTYSNLFIALPCLKEQEKIASFLTSIDDKINQINQQIDKTEIYKKGLLQQMFI